MRTGLLNGFQLKLLMVVLMVLDHLYVFLPGMPDWFTWLGRLVAPVFAYLMVEGYMHTRNRLRYIKRLFKAGIIMMAGNLLLSALFPGTLMQNIFLSLGVGAGMLYYCDQWIQYRGRSDAIAVIALFVFAFFTEGAILIPAIALVFYYLRKNTVLMFAAYIGLMALLVPALTTMFPQILMIFAVIPILLYNGKRGPDSAVARNFFYIFYPAHIWILFVVQQLFYTA